ncbi:MAG: undecaprenyl-diphosphate phosphatase [Opitutae bacterium]|nr:undecaprenyl-diphosphate phosphatase [Opitutae bacterium]
MKKFAIFATGASFVAAGIVALCAQENFPHNNEDSGDNAGGAIVATIDVSGDNSAEARDNSVKENPQVATTVAPRRAEEVFDAKNAAILGIVEGLTEYLPISSTGHLILANSVLGLDTEDSLLVRGCGENVDCGENLVRDSKGEIVSVKSAADAYSIIIQFGAIVAVIFAYWRRVSGTIIGVLRRDVPSLRLARNLIVAFIPAAVLGFLFSNKIEEFLFNPVSVAIALIVGGILMLVVERRRKRLVAAMPQNYATEIDLQDMSARQSLVVGLMQCLALWPGMSRSMSTIVGGYVAGLSPRRATEFSFLLGLITLSAASIYKTLKSYTEMLDAFGAGVSLLGLAIAFVAAFASVKWLVEWISRHGLAAFSWYRFALAAVVLVWAFC